MAANVADRAVIVYNRDYDPTANFEQRRYRINEENGSGDVHVGVSYGRSIEFFLVECVDVLEDARALIGPWTPAKRFIQLGLSCKDRAKDTFVKLVDRDYPNPDDKTDANYDELVRNMCTDLADHIMLGNKV